MITQVYCLETNSQGGGREKLFGVIQEYHFWILEYLYIWISFILLYRESLVNEIDLNLFFKIC